MPDIKKFWASVNKLADTLPNPSFITSIEDETRGWVGGRVFPAEPKLAAQRVIEGTHKLSTEDEIKSYHAGLDRNNKICAAMEVQKANKQVLSIDQSLAEALRLVNK
jgi:hypothetical protein